jgi:CheY-like chemotaxis protein
MPPRPPIARLVPTERVNTLGLDARELAALLDLLDSREGGPDRRANREFARWPYRHPTIVVRLTHPGGSAVTLHLAGRNISRGGVSLLHNAYIHPGTRCEVSLIRAKGGRTDAPGKVCRCTHRQGRLHEVGIKFDRPVRVRTFVPAGAKTTVLSLERVDAARLKGRVLHIEDSALEAKIFAHYVRETGLVIEHVGTGTEGIAKARGNFSIIVLDLNLPDVQGTEVLAAIRAKGITTPVLMLTADPRLVLAGPQQDAPDTLLLRKPHTQLQLLQHLGELLLGHDLENGPRTGDDSPALPKGMGVAELQAMSAELEAAIRKSDEAELARVCTQLRAIAPLLGLTDVATAAEHAVLALGKPESGATTADLLAACRRAGGNAASPA